MDYWEYRELHRWQTPYMEPAAQQLGLQGWEFVAITPTGSWLFKRRIAIMPSMTNEG